MQVVELSDRVGSGHEGQELREELAGVRAALEEDVRAVVQRVEDLATGELLVNVGGGVCVCVVYVAMVAVVVERGAVSG